jgi:hypothetical protein
MKPRAAFKRLSCTGATSAGGETMPRHWRTRTWRAALIAAAISLATVALAACGDDDIGGRDDAPSRAVASGTSAAAPDTFSSSGGDSAKSGSSGAGASATVAADTSLPSAADIDRKIIFNASIALDVTDVTRAFDDVGAIAKVGGGYVERSSFSGNQDASQRSASLTVRVPVARYDDTLAAIRGVQGASVKSETSKSNEVTEDYTDLQSRLRTLQATEQQYLTLLAQAKTQQEILTMTDRLNSVRGQIEQTQGRLNLLDSMTSLATIDVALAPIPLVQAEPKSDDGPKGVRESFVDAWEASLEVGRYVAAAGAAASVVIIWLAIPVGLAFLSFRALRRRMPVRVAPPPPPPPTVA